jgi:F-type H+-transporting ATPase subunit alpha
VLEFEDKFFDYMDKNGTDVLSAIRETGVVSEDTEAKLKKALESFKAEFGN